MRRNALDILISIFALLTSGGCQVEENAQVSGLGWVKFSLEVETTANVQPKEAFALTLTSTADGKSYTWENIEDYSSYESLYVGSYTASVVSGTPQAEGYNCQCYTGQTLFAIQESNTVNIHIPAKLSQSMLYVSLGDELLTVYPDCKVSVHSIGGGFNFVDFDTDEPLLLNPGETYFLVYLKEQEEKEVIISPKFKLMTTMSESYSVNLNLENENTLTISCEDQKASVNLEDFTGSAIPQIETQGFKSDEIIQLFEGYPSAQQLIMNVTAPAGIEAVVLTTTDDYNALEGLPKECDLTNPPILLLEKGLKVEEKNNETMSIDFSSLIENLSINEDTHVKFTVYVLDKLSRVSPLTTLDVEIVNLEIGLISKTNAIVGQNEASVTLSLNSEYVEPHDFSINILDENGGVKSIVPILESEIDKEKNAITLKFSVGEGIDEVPIRIDYMDKPKIRTEIERTVPEYTVEEDAYATHALIQIQSADKNLIREVVRYGRPYCDDMPMTVSNRDLEHGVIWIVGLNPAQQYRIKLVVVDGAFAPSFSLTTEKALQLPNGDFEETEEWINYINLPKGGIYSNTVFPIYNMQNIMDVKVWWMQKAWTSVNAKTFCQEAKNHNSWYMQPSAIIDFDNHASGVKSVKLTSVGWSVDGPEIQPYLQEKDKHLPYNANVPEVKHSAAGKLFLGMYKFEPITETEIYEEGIKFEARPSSLNGYYKYSSLSNLIDDAGFVEIELSNNESTNPIVIGRAKMEFKEAPDFVAFNLPIEYTMIGIKATHLKMLFSSSKGAGSIEYEDINVPVAPDVPMSVVKGSSLWIDNLSFSY